MKKPSTDAQELLGRVDLFTGMSARQRKRLASVSKEVDFSPGHVVALEGRSAIGFQLIVSGEAAVSVGDAERRRLGPGEYFGEISMIDGKPRSATITAVTELSTLAVTHTDFERLLDDEPAFARTLLLLLCDRLRESEADR